MSDFHLPYHWLPYDDKAPRKGDLSRFIEEAVRAHILELSAAQAKAANIEVDEADLTRMVAEAVLWARDTAAVAVVATQAH